MTSQTKSAATLARELAHRMDREGAIALRGAANLVLLKHALEHLVSTSGLSLDFDPDSDPELRDYLLVTSSGALRGASVGSAIGLLVGLLVGQPRAMTSFGAALGGAFGAAQAADLVRRGWRVRATWDPLGAALVEIRSE